MKPLILWVLIASTIPVRSASNDNAMKLSGPSNGSRICENTPVLSWHPVDCDFYKIWIDGIFMDSVRAPRNWYIPFPMSYGEHRWHVTALKAGAEYPGEPFVFTIADEPLASLPENALLLREDWKVISSLFAGRDGSAISTRNVNTAGWRSTSLPATVLAVLVRNGIYPNPYVGINNMKIPDMNDGFNETYDLLRYSHIKDRNPWKDPYWYRRTFKIPDSFKEKKIWLTLGEINYRAEVWLNGRQLADTAGVVGMERSFRFDITSLALQAEENVLAIAIYPPDHPGRPAAPPLTPLADPGTNMADGMLSKDYTKWDVLGWDWIPAIRDRDMGITEDVYVHATEEVELDNLYVTSDLPLPDTSFASVTISLDLVNHSDYIKKGMVTASISGEGTEILLEESFAAGPHDTIHFLWDEQNKPQLHIQSPGLWWPSGYGRPVLYHLNIAAETDGVQRSKKHLKFGIREVETCLGPKERVYKINGKEIYCKGGNWVPDMMLNWTASRYEHEIRLTKNANLNMLRIWGPSGAPPEVFYDAADASGIMLWQDFLNDFWGTFRNSPGFRPEESLFRKATVSITKRYRNHPSLVIWSSGNEGPNPREDLIVNEILPQYDGRDSRHYLKISNGDGLHGGGPYHTLEPSAYFTDPKLNGFSSEIGPSGVPVFESVLKFMPHPGEQWLEGRFPLDGVWAYHDANDWPGSDLRKFSSYDQIIRSYYGPADSSRHSGVEDYLRRCQMLNHDVYRASIESINSQLWENSSGILLWKSNASWPSMTWQIYDWYLQAHAGYYGAKKAAAPLSVYYNRETQKVEVLNATCILRHQAKVTAELYGEDMAERWSTSETIDLHESSVASLTEAVPVTIDPCFLRLTVQSEQGMQLAENFYWLSTENMFSNLDHLPEPVLSISSRKEDSEQKISYAITLFNEGGGLALMTELKLVDPLTNLEILPAFWTENYLSLLPGEKKEVRVELDTPDPPGEIMLSFRAYNMEKSQVYHLPAK
jgi:hypothetical protein